MNVCTRNWHNNSYIKQYLNATVLILYVQNHDNQDTSNSGRLFTYSLGLGREMRLRNPGQHRTTQTAPRAEGSPVMGGQYQ